MANDGLSQEEMVKLLFKGYMNTGSSSHDKDFFEETVFENKNKPSCMADILPSRKRRHALILKMFRGSDHLLPIMPSYPLP